MKVHVLVPNTTTVACGRPSHSATTPFRDRVTCKACRKTALYKTLPTLPRKYRKTK